MRRAFNKFQREEIIGKQNYKCRICGEGFTDNRRPQYDHISGDDSDNRIENGQALCANCHDVKSRKQTVKRSRDKKDLDIVEYCPLCGHDIDSEDYELETDEDGYEIEQEFQNANDWIECVNCESDFMIIRHDPSNIQESTNKEYENVVEYCMSCGIEWDEPGDSNEKIICDDCDSKFYVWIKKYSE